MKKNIDLNNVIPIAVRLAIKTLKFSKGGFSKEEKKELGEDLLELAIYLLEDSLD